MKPNERFTANMEMRYSKLVEFGYDHLNACYEILNECSSNWEARYRNHCARSIEHFQGATKVLEELEKHSVNIDQDDINRKRVEINQLIGSLRLGFIEQLDRLNLLYQLRNSRVRVD